jgi:N-terminal domain of (some) glycogen debranching enzymes
MTLTILDGSTFCICADDGAIHEGAHGFYADDTRFLSRLALTVNGERPMPLSAGKVEYFAAAFFLRNAPAGGLAADELLIRSERFVTDDLQEHIVITNLIGDAVTVELAVELAADFADILSIKHHDFALGDPALA